MFDISDVGSAEEIPMGVGASKIAHVLSMMKIMVWRTRRNWNQLSRIPGEIVSTVLLTSLIHTNEKECPERHQVATHQPWTNGPWQYVSHKELNRVRVRCGDSNCRLVLVMYLMYSFV